MPPLGCSTFANIVRRLNLVSLPGELVNDAMLISCGSRSVKSGLGF